MFETIADRIFQQQDWKCCFSLKDNKKIEKINSEFLELKGTIRLLESFIYSISTLILLHDRKQQIRQMIIGAMM